MTCFGTYNLVFLHITCISTSCPKIAKTLPCCLPFLSFLIAFCGEAFKFMQYHFQCLLLFLGLLDIFFWEILPMTIFWMLSSGSLRVLSLILRPNDEFFTSIQQMNNISIPPTLREVYVLFFETITGLRIMKSLNTNPDND